MVVPPQLYLRCPQPQNTAGRGVARRQLGIKPRLHDRGFSRTPRGQPKYGLPNPLLFHECSNATNLGYTPEASIDLSPCVGLRSLSLTFGVPYTELYHSAFPWICETLCTVPRDNQIEELKLSLYITHPRNSQHDVFPPPQIGFFNYERWERLGHVLCTPRYAATLRQVTFQLIHHGIDVRGYSILAEQRLGKIGAKVTWRFMRDDSPEAD